MYYFDNVYLQQYVDQEVDLMVFDGYDWLSIADRSDLQNPIKGNGYDASGQDHYFLYKSVEKIKVGNQIFTLDQLQTQFTGKPPEEDGGESSSKGETSSGDDFESSDDELPANDESPDKKEPDLSWHSPMYNIGRDLIAEYRKMKTCRP